MPNTGESGSRAPVDSSDALQPWQLFTLAGLIGATIVVFMSRGQTPAGIILLSLIIFAAAFVGLAALRTFLPLAGIMTDAGAEVLGGRTRAALEREKTLLLRSIKELEFDRGMRKVSEKDFAEMSARLRARAARLMRQLDAGSLYRQEIEREVERRLANAGAAARNPAHTAETGHIGAGRAASREGTRTGGMGPVPPFRDADSGPAGSGSSYSQARASTADPDSPVSDPGPPIPDSQSRTALCSSCGTANDPDARFCKSCGTRLERNA